MSDIFISYTSSDREKAKILAEVLEEQGWSVWWDRKIPPGRSFDEVITEALDAARCVIVLWSKESVKSDWVKEEASEGARRKILVPALIEDVGIPLGFRRIQAAQLIDWQGNATDPNVRQLIESIASLISHPQEVKKEKRQENNVGDEKQEKHPAQSEEIVDPQKVIEKEKREKNNNMKTAEAPDGGVQNNDGITVPQIKFRSQPMKNLTKDEVKTMLKQHGFFCKSSWLDGTRKYANPEGSGFCNKYELQKDGKVIYNHASSITWQQSGSGKCRNYDEANAYIDTWNREKLPGLVIGCFRPLRRACR